MKTIVKIKINRNSLNLVSMQRNFLQASPNLVRLSL
jgi:hypothetical protein